MHILMIPEDATNPDQALITSCTTMGASPLNKSGLMPKSALTKRIRWPRTMPNFITASSLTKEAKAKIMIWRQDDLLCRPALLKVIIHESHIDN